jgi:hypothetical protein
VAGHRRDLSESRETPRVHRVQIRLGIGTGPAIIKLLAGAALTAALVFGFHRRWNIFVLLFLGLLWAIVVAGLILAPIISGLVADFLGQFRHTRPPLEHEVEIDRGLWAPATPPTYPATRIEAGRQSSADEVLAGQPMPLGMAAGFDWDGLVEAVAASLETVLGEGYTVEGDSTSIVLRHGDMVRKVNLGSIFQPPPPDASERAMRACVKMMDEAQMFAMRVQSSPWPCRQGRGEGDAQDLPRPRARIDNGEIQMVWSDGLGVVVRLVPVPLTSAPGRGDRPGW